VSGRFSLFYYTIIQVMFECNFHAQDIDKCASNHNYNPMLIIKIAHIRLVVNPGGFLRQNLHVISQIIAIRQQRWG